VTTAVRSSAEEQARHGGDDPGAPSLAVKRPEQHKYNYTRYMKNLKPNGTTSATCSAGTSLSIPS
jgi:hypothetical protein